LSDLEHGHLLSLFDLAMPAHSKAKFTSAARKIIPLIDLLFKNKDIKVNEIVDFLKNNFCLRYLGNSDTGLEAYQDFYQAFTDPVTSMTGMIKILKAFKACDP
jgi:hypothetical protein